MVFHAVSTNHAPAPGGHYSQALRSGQILWTSGQVGIDPETGEIPAEFAAQTRQMLSNLRAILEEAGLTLTDVVKVTCFITDVRRFAEFNAIYAEFFGDHLPARSTIGSALAGGFLIEIEAVAVAATTFTLP